MHGVCAVKDGLFFKSVFFHSSFRSSLRPVSYFDWPEPTDRGKKRTFAEWIVTKQRGSLRKCLLPPSTTRISIYPLDLSTNRIVAFGVQKILVKFDRSRENEREMRPRRTAVRVPGRARRDRSVFSFGTEKGQAVTVNGADDRVSTRRSG